MSRTWPTTHDHQGKKALAAEGMFLGARPHSFVRKVGEKMKDKFTRLGKVFGANKKQQRKKRKDTLSEATGHRVKIFYIREDVSRVLPHKRYATKAGPGFVMQQTLRAAHQIFQKEYPDMPISYSKFTKLRPKNVRKISSTFLDTCQCVYCCNIKLKLIALNRAVGLSGGADHSIKLTDERALYRFVVCSHDPSPFPKAECVQGSCQDCSDVGATIRQHFQPVTSLPLMVTWSRWSKADSGKREPVIRRDTVHALVEELIEDVQRPTQSSTFVRHLFQADWQHRQYRALKSSLTAGQLLLVLDFAENGKSHFQDEIKSAHFGKHQFSLHPVVGFYKSRDGHEVRHALNFLTDDIQHDHHAVHKFLQLALDKFQQQGIISNTSEVFLFSDNCSAQYKCKGSFADLSHYTQHIQHVYFGAEHGKGEADGETGVISKAVGTAVLCRQTTIRNAKDFFEYCQDHLARDEATLKREFVLVDPSDINRKRPETNVKTVKGCRAFHQVVKVKPMVIKARHLACFCLHCQCGHEVRCVNKDYTTPYTTIHLQSVEEEEETCEPTATSPMPSRDEFFDKQQKELQQARLAGFAKFVQCTHKCLLEAQAYPLPPVTREPQFSSDVQDDQAAAQRGPTKDRFPKRTTADGNCLPRALSAAVYGTEDFHKELRVRLVCELALNKCKYLSPAYISRGGPQDGENSLLYYKVSGDFYALSSIDQAFECEVMATIQNSKDMGMWHLLAAANVLGATIFSVYPETGGQPQHEGNRSFLPDSPTLPFPIYIQWSSISSSPTDPYFQPNHFVPVVRKKQQEQQKILLGDFVLVSVPSARQPNRTTDFRAIVVEPPSTVTLLEGELMVKFLKQQGRYYVFPPADDLSVVRQSEIKKLPHPTINNRGHYLF